MICTKYKPLMFLPIPHQIFIHCMPYIYSFFKTIPKLSLILSIIRVSRWQTALDPLGSHLRLWNYCGSNVDRTLCAQWLCSPFINGPVWMVMKHPVPRCHFITGCCWRVITWCAPGDQCLWSHNKSQSFIMAAQIGCSHVAMGELLIMWMVGWGCAHSTVM